MSTENPKLNFFSNTENQEFNNSDASAEKNDMKISESWIYKGFIKVANRLIQRPLSIFRLLKQVVAHIQKYDSVKELGIEVKNQLFVLMRLLKAYAKGEYRNISVQGIVGTAAALLYFVAPIDIIPDFLIFGFADDAALIIWVYTNYKREIDEFLEWEDRKKVKIELGEEDRI